MARVEGLVELVRVFRMLQEQNKDVFCLLSGGKGVGKSTAMLQIGRIYWQTYGLVCPGCKITWMYTGKSREPWHPERCSKCGTIGVKPSTTDTFPFEQFMGWDNVDISQKIRNATMYAPLLADEAVRFMMAEDWNLRESKRLKKLAAQCRPKRLLFMANVPVFNWIDRKYKDGMATCWIRIIMRGVAVVRFPNMGETADAWDWEKFSKGLGSYNEIDILTPSGKEKLIHRCEAMKQRGVITDWFTIPPYPAPEYAQYEEERNKRAFAEEEEDELKVTDYARIAAFKLYKRWDEITSSLDNWNLRSPIPGVRKRKPTPTLEWVREILSLPNVKPVSAVTIHQWVKDVEKSLEEQK